MRKITSGMLLILLLVFGSMVGQINTYPYIQNFDAFSLCGTSCGSVCALTEQWSNDATDDIDWLSDINGTSSANTGPGGDHTTGSGVYLYVETSGSCSGGDLARLISPAFNLTTVAVPELSFWYHMFGSNMGDLSVDISTNGGGSWTQVISPFSQNLNAWQERTLDLTPYSTQTNVRFRFTFSTGSSFTSDVAIDDFSIQSNIDGPPTAVCSNYTAQLDAAGNATITGTNVDGGSSDGEGAVTLSVSPNTFSCADIGANTVTLTVTDSGGQTATCTATVTVEDNVAPTISCPSDITVNTDAGVCGAVVNYTIPTATDNCTGGGAPGILLPGSVYNLTTLAGNWGWGVTDWNSSDPINNVTEVAAVETVLSNGYVFGAPGSTPYNGIYSWPSPGGSMEFTSSCGVIDFDSLSFLSTRSYSSATVITVEYRTGAGPWNVAATTTTGALGVATGSTANQYTISFPMVTGDQFRFTSNGSQLSLHELWINGACSAVSSTTVAQTDTTGLSSGDVFPVGTTTLQYTATDASGNTSTCSFDITVTDNEAPTAVCVAPFTVQLDAAGAASITAADIDGGSTDACGIASIAIDQTDFTCTDVGDNTITLTVTDNNGNTATCSTIVTVEDNVAPAAVCVAPFTVQLDAAGDASITAADIDGGSTDACGIASIAIDQTDFTCADVGDNTITLTVTDNNGNTATCSTTVTVEDNVAPTVVCVAPFTVQLDASGNASITAADIDGGSTDACGVASIAIDQTDFTCADVGDNTITLTVTDNNGNTATCSTTVTVEDNVAPTAVCVAPFTVQLDASGAASITAADVDGGSTDACGIASIAIDQTDFTCADVGDNTITLTVTDNNGNTATCSTTVTVEDNVAPVISCPADLVVDNDPGDCGALITFANAVAVDACGIASVVQTAGPASGTVFPIGITTIEFTATDVNNNTATCSFTVTVNDTEAPLAVCQDITIQLDPVSGLATIDPADIDGGSTDNCGIASLSASQTSFDCSDVGDNTVTLTVTDTSGVVSTCVATVTVEDVTAPLAACQNITVQLDDMGMASISGIDVDGGSSDACGIVSYDLDIDTFDCSNVGDNQVVLTVTDPSGNSSSCTATVTVEDNVAPVLVCQDITLSLDENGMASITPEDVTETIDDACGIFTSAVDITDFDCLDVGMTITVQVFTQDNNGNLATCFANVTVVDDLAPVITCPEDQTVDPGINDLFYEVPDYWALGEATATDNCTDPVIDLVQDPAPGTLLSDGTYTITLTATDESGNVADCSFELTVDSILGNENTELTLEAITMYPNPAADRVFLSNPQGMQLEAVQIFDLSGRLISTMNLNGSVETTIQLDIDTLSTAAYWVVVQGAQGRTTFRLLKE